MKFSRVLRLPCGTEINFPSDAPRPPARTNAARALHRQASQFAAPSSTSVTRSSQFAARRTKIASRQLKIATRQTKMPPPSSLPMPRATKTATAATMTSRRNFNGAGTRRKKGRNSMNHSIYQHFRRKAKRPHRAGPPRRRRFRPRRHAQCSRALCHHSGCRHCRRRWRHRACRRWNLHRRRQP